METDFWEHNDQNQYVENYYKNQEVYMVASYGKISDLHDLLLKVMFLVLSEVLP